MHSNVTGVVEVEDRSGYGRLGQVVGRERGRDRSNYFRYKVKVKVNEAESFKVRIGLTKYSDSTVTHGI